jgi:hypothetical protein
MYLFLCLLILIFPLFSWYAFTGVGSLCSAFILPLLDRVLQDYEYVRFLVLFPIHGHRAWITVDSLVFLCLGQDAWLSLGCLKKCVVLVCLDPLALYLSTILVSESVFLAHVSMFKASFLLVGIPIKWQLLFSTQVYCCSPYILCFRFHLAWDFHSGLFFIS